MTVHTPRLPQPILPLPEMRSGKPEPTGFWQGKFAQEAMPFLTSLLLHVGLIVIGLVVGKAIVDTVRGKPARTQESVVQTSIFGENGKGGGVPDPGISGNGQQATQTRYPEFKPEDAGWSPNPGANLQTALLSGADDATGAAAPVIGIGTRHGSTRKGSPGGSDTGGGDGLVAMFGLEDNLGGRPGPKGIFGVPPGPAGAYPTVVYVCDATGSMMPHFDNLRDELRTAIKHLMPSQSFNIMFFQGEKVWAANETTLLVNKPENRAKAFDFLEKVYPSNETNPIPALEMALKQKPQMIWFLTDGDFPDNEAVLKFIRERNAGNKTVINTIAFVNKGDRYEEILRTIAKETGGVHRFVGEQDLGR